MRSWIYAGVLATAGLLSPTFAEGEGNEKKPDYAWSNHTNQLATGPYVYGAFRVPPDFIGRLLQSNAAPDDDPFSDGTSEQEVAKRLSFIEIIPQVSLQQLPDCLPSAPSYRDISKPLIQNGIALKDKEWTLLSSGLGGDQHLYFCTSLENAGIIEQLMPHRCGTPRSIAQLATLVSIDHQTLRNTAWTINTLIRMSPVTHTRYGNHGRSGERSGFHLHAGNGSKSDYEMEPTLGEDNHLLDCRLSFSSITQNPPILISQQTSVTTQVKEPFILDCGTHGNDRRNYFLVLHSRASAHHPPTSGNPYISMKTIKGIYAMNPSAKTKTAPATSFILRTYRTNTSFLNKLRGKVDGRSNDDDDPFSDAPQTTGLNDTPKPPIRVKLTRANKCHHPGDKIYNITPHLEFLGLHKFKGEWVYYNHTRSQIIINGTPSLHSRVSAVMHEIITGPRNINFQARIVTVDHKGLNYIEWTPEKIRQANPQFLAKYATTTRSGEKSTHGKAPSTKSEKNPVTGKPIEGYDYHFEVEPTIGEFGERIDLRYSIKSKPLGDSKIIVKITSSRSLKDGKPSIIELGHPSSATRTHLLILNADIILSDGSFYRDRFKPAE